MSGKPFQSCLIRVMLAISSLAYASRIDGAEPSRSTKGANQEAETHRPNPGDVRAVALSNNRFAVDLYQELRNQKENMFFSPISISTVLAMTAAGAKGETGAQMAEVLHLLDDELPESISRLHRGVGALCKLVSVECKGVQLKMANRLWGSADFPFDREFLQITREQYGAELASIDFSDCELARQTINDWVKIQTNNKITKLIPPGVLSADSRLVLTNAIHFHGEWEDAFHRNDTALAPFHSVEEQQVDVPMMRQAGEFRYAETQDLQFLELPYAGQALSMVILLPKKVHGLFELDATLTADTVQQGIRDLRRKEVCVFLPKFKMNLKYELAHVLISVGMPLPFSGQADFSGISDAEGLMISDVVHQACVEVTEVGTEAAAATAVTMVLASAVISERREPTVFRADHPFVFLIRDNSSGAILFLGRYVQPN